MWNKIIFGIIQLLLIFSGIVILVTSIKSSPLLAMGAFIGVIYLVYYLGLKFFFGDDWK
ncbi:MAG: hypothetical protein GXO13_03910 [Epsilonproteobacteria bacterium]|jgi:hypothetical protein|nr:hypothetical protein [Campylobacterota bacterium]